MMLKIKNKIYYKIKENKLYKDYKKLIKLIYKTVKSNL